MSDRAPRSAYRSGGWGDPTLSIIEQLGPLLNANSEVDAWNHATTFVKDHFSTDLSAAFEYLGSNRAAIRSTKGSVVAAGDLLFAFAPDSQAAFIKTCGQVCVSGDITTDPRFEAPRLLTAANVRSSMSVAFDLASGDAALLGVYSTQPDQFADAESEMLGVFARLLGTVIDRIRQQRELEVSARIDPVTGLDNRSTILADMEVRLCAGRDVTALVIDLDGFKSVNDQHGHRVGDLVLRTVARRLERSLEADDSLGRLGGDEFLLLLDGFRGTMRAEVVIGHIEEIIMIESRDGQRVGLDRDQSQSTGRRRHRPARTGGPNDVRRQRTRPRPRESGSSRRTDDRRGARPVGLASECRPRDGR